MPTNPSHSVNSVIRSTLVKKLVIFLLVSWFVSTIGEVTQCYDCFSDIRLEEDLDFEDKGSKCTNISVCVPELTTTTAATPVDPDEPNVPQKPPQNEICILRVTDGKAATGHIRIRKYGCSDDHFKQFTDVDAEGCQTPAGLAEINKFTRGNKTEEEASVKYVEFCSCNKTDLCNTWLSKAPPGVPTLKPKTGGGAVSSLVFCFYLLPLLSFLL